MVLIAIQGGAGAAGAPRPRRPLVHRRGRRGRGPGGAGRCPLPASPGPPRPRPHRPRGVPAGARLDAGSQTLEFALLLPALALLLVIGLHAALVASDLVLAQGLAREAARAAAVTDDGGVRAAVRQAAGDQPVQLTLTPPAPRAPGTLVTAEVRVASRGFHALGTELWLPARAVTRVEGP